MLYIIEGIDGIGKSTLTEQIKKYYEINGKRAIFVKESVVKDRHEKESRVRKIKQLVEECPYDVFYDRATIIDDFIYEPIMLNKSSTLPLECIDILRKVKIIYLNGDFDMCVERISQRGDEYIPAVRSLLRSIDEAYTNFFYENKLDVSVVDVGDENPFGVFVKVLKVIEKKEFKVAHIVPVSSLELLRDNMYVMCLAHLVDNKKYANFYRNFSGYVLMDNGAAEGEQLDFKGLLEAYEKIQPDEIVIPDTLCDSFDTIRKMNEFLEFAQLQNLDYKMMGVPQGKTFEEWKACAEAMVASDRINTIGVSKFLEMQTHDPLIRYKAVAYINKLIHMHNRHDLEVHLLGCSERSDIVKRIHEEFDFVRGCDSALGYIYTQSGERVYGDTPRPQGEIDFINGNSYDNLKTTLQDMEIAMGCYDNGYSSTWDNWED